MRPPSPWSAFTIAPGSCANSSTTTTKNLESTDSATKIISLHSWLNCLRNSSRRRTSSIRPLTAPQYVTFDDCYPVDPICQNDVKCKLKQLSAKQREVVSSLV